MDYVPFVAYNRGADAPDDAAWVQFAGVVQTEYDDEEGAHSNGEGADGEEWGNEEEWEDEDAGPHHGFGYQQANHAQFEDEDEDEVYPLDAEVERMFPTFRCPIQ